MPHVTAEVLAVLNPHQVSAVLSGNSANKGGYPVPGPQSLTATSAMSKNCFVDDNTWRLIVENGEFDDIVVGSSFCALAYIDQALRQNRFRKILVLERGGFWLPDHFQNLLLPFQFVRHDVSETFPWELTRKTVQGEKVSLAFGSSPFFGGRSSFWSIWSPRPIGSDFDLMDDFPASMKEIAKGFDKDVEKLLHIKPANTIKDPVFEVLQGLFDDYLSEGKGKITRAEGTEPARLATGVFDGTSTRRFKQFSAVGPMLELNEYQNKLARKDKPEGCPIMLATDTVIERFEVEPGDGGKLHARVLHTSRGALDLRGGKTNVILATGPIPATTILMNSIGDKLRNRAGKRFTAHFRSNIKARFKHSEAWLKSQALPSHPVVAACHVRGRGIKDLQWHVQVNGIHKPAEKESCTDEELLQSAQADSVEFACLAPDYEAALSTRQFYGSQSYIIVSCSPLGELPKGTNSWVKHNKSNPDVTTNVRLQIDIDKDAMALWDQMEESIFDAIKVVADTQAHTLEHWNYITSKWEAVAQPVKKTHTRRIDYLFHKASTLYMADDLSKDETASVDSNYRPHGLEAGNVYVTSAALFPTAGSWNPTPTVCGFAQDLAKRLVSNVVDAAPDGDED
ncbi:hypothetical protein BD779DRAFT_1455854 [Infundibulicybe gibba]|nr:hypothetical protein BD779DRAFT_1455854 [Infundibulicybe gibba]